LEAGFFRMEMSPNEKHLSTLRALSFPLVMYAPLPASYVSGITTTGTYFLAPDVDSDISDRRKMRAVAMGIVCNTNLSVMLAFVILF
jgi:hypothetical protein